MGPGEKLTLWSFLCAVFGTLLVLAGIVLGFVAGRYTDQGYLSRLKNLTAQALESRKRKQAQWTPFRRIQSNNIPTIPVPFRLRLQVYLDSEDNTVPLMIRVAADAEGHYSNTVSGPAGVVEQLMTEPQTYYVSVSHPSINYRIGVLGWIDRRGK